MIINRTTLEVRKLECISAGWDPKNKSLEDHAIWTLLIDRYVDIGDLEFPTKHDVEKVVVK